MHTTSASLLKRLQEPDAQEAWDRFAALYAPLLDQWAHRLGLPDNDAADLVQEVFLLLLRRLPLFEYQANRSFRAWLWTVTVNIWKDQRLRKGLPVPLESLEAAASDGAVALAEQEYQRYLVNRALRILRTDFEPAVWQAFWKVTVEGQKPLDVAEELALSVNAVYLARSRVLARLRQELEGLWP
jgi:RNA polymerase sigma-70 factor, ECF subfamily